MNIVISGVMRVDSVSWRGDPWEKSYETVRPGHWGDHQRRSCHRHQEQQHLQLVIMVTMTASHQSQDYQDYSLLDAVLEDLAPMLKDLSRVCQDYRRRMRMAPELSLKTNLWLRHFLRLRCWWQLSRPSGDILSTAWWWVRTITWHHYTGWSMITRCH